MTELRAEKNEQVNWKSKKNLLLNTLKKNIFLLVPFLLVHFSFTWSTLSPSITGSDVLLPMQSFPLALLNLTNQSICHSCWKGSRQGHRVGMAINMKPRRIAMAWPKTPANLFPSLSPCFLHGQIRTFTEMFSTILFASFLHYDSIPVFECIYPTTTTYLVNCPAEIFKNPINVITKKFPCEHPVCSFNINTLKWYQSSLNFSCGRAQIMWFIQRTHKLNISVARVIDTMAQRKISKIT